MRVDSIDSTTSENRLGTEVAGVSVGDGLDGERHRGCSEGGEGSSSSSGIGTISQRCQQYEQYEQYQLLPVPFEIGVISAALRSANWPQDRGFVEAKVRSVLQVAEANNHTSIVLGAWGCGAFGNLTAEVAGCFARVLAEGGSGKIERVVFAIPSADKADCFRKQASLGPPAPGCT
jgi:O-acetyl-ADP-ribose deacetylase (regulator of RNase III)